jgi:cytoskeletal protein CcmA (bactofilin family)
VAESNTEFGTIIGPDASFKGELNFDSAAKVLGKIEGSITSKARIHIAEGAACRATVKAKEIAVEGNVEGNLEAADRVELRPKGTVTGDITAARMVMAEGASIDGHCRIGVNGQTGARPRTAEAEVKPVAQQQQQQQQHAQAAAAKK